MRTTTQPTDKEVLAAMTYAAMTDGELLDEMRKPRRRLG
jgi:hypothetical protein